MSSQSSTPKPVVSFRDWNTSAIMYMQPKINERGGKSINIISNQTKRSLHISTPLMMTWGIADFVDEKGESDGKYTISLQFPNDDYKSKDTDDFLQKLKDFENQILDDAVKNSEKWWGKKMTRDICEFSYFPFLKYSKNKDTKEVDYTKPPSIRAKVPNYGGKWGVEIYNTNSELIFPSSTNDMLTPVDFVQKLSNVACVLQCSGIWIGGKGWGITWKMIQCVVKPREVVSVYGKCHVELSRDDVDKMDKPLVKDVAEIDEEEVIPAEPKQPPVSTMVEDSDDESSPVPTDPPVTADVSVEEPKTEVPAAEPQAATAPKKVVKKVAPLFAAQTTATPAPIQEEAKPAEPVVAKKIVKKKVVA